ncbi:hypothetical protein MtrunA17_Chr8g0343711 [Medicago truncatula]|uniref:Uncharacterized protein n=1 Tax=Medicago truncatula TaxID=3880 RepID=A0A396GDA4_MEDTR|nr:hypothetical protein MtrunA17_Chr8g0343711 [Medicago truncatula]
MLEEEPKKDNFCFLIYHQPPLFFFASTRQFNEIIGSVFVL